MNKEIANKVICKMEDILGTDLYRHVKKLRKTWYDCDFLNTLRRKVNFLAINLKHKLGLADKKPLILHLGCGGQHFDDYVNIDFRKTRATDLVCDIRRLPYPDGSVGLIETYHVIEHLNRHDLSIALEEWHRVLVVGGRLIIECPDFDEAIKEYMQGNEKRINNIFGLQRFPGDVHQFGYNFKRLKKALGEVGFKDIEEEKPQDYHNKDEPCLRAVCVKGNNS